MSPNLNPTTQSFARQVCETAHSCTGSCHQGRACDCFASRPPTRLERFAFGTLVVLTGGGAVVLVGLCVWSLLR
jgi:hypothetical protein